MQLGLNERQIKSVLFTKEQYEITNSVYQEVNIIWKTTATIELIELVEKGVFSFNDAKGRGAKYFLNK